MTPWTDCSTQLGTNVRPKLPGSYAALPTARDHTVNKHSENAKLRQGNPKPNPNPNVTYPDHR